MNKLFALKHFFKLLLTFFFLLSFSNSFAQNKAMPQDSTTILSHEELEQCLQRSTDLSKRSVQLKEQSTHLLILSNDIKNLTNERENMAVDFHSTTSVEEYNQLNQQLETLSQQYKNDASLFNNQVKQYKTDIIRLKNECDDKKYYQ